MKGNQSVFATVLAKVTLFLAWVLPVMAIACWVFWNDVAPFVVGNLNNQFDLQGLSAGSKLVGFAISMTGALVYTYGLLGLKNTFTEASLGQPYSLLALSGFNRFAWVILIMVPFGVVQNTLYIVVYSLSDPAHQGMLRITFGTPEIKSLFIGVLLVFVARVFAQGKAAKDENDTFI